MSFSKEGNTAHYEQEHSGDRIEQVESYGGIAGLQQDQIAVEARGRDASDMPKGYYRSKYFLGSYVVCHARLLRSFCADQLAGHSHEFYYCQRLVCSCSSALDHHQ